MDTLTPLLSRFSLSARAFYAGSPCGVFHFAEAGQGYLHMLRQGAVHIEHSGRDTITLTQPSLIFYPRPQPHRFVVESSDSQIVCIRFEFGAALGNPLLHALPECLIIPLSQMSALAPALELLFAEAFASEAGRQAALDRLAEYVLLLLLRYCIQQQHTHSGLLAGLADPQLCPIITAMHQRPEHHWSIAELAAISHLSRARFAAHFHQTLGQTPMAYLTDWRIAVAQTLLKNGQPLKRVAPAVGYSHPIALARVFAQRVGCGPTEWVRRLDWAESSIN